MEAQEQVNDLRLCEKCFSKLADEATFCPECGAPCSDDPSHSDGSDSAIYPELARANLLRMRGEYKMAEEVCRAILRRYPNNTSAAGLLGDISAETGELEDAMRWYELVLDLTPDAEAERAKLEVIHRRLKEQEALSTAELLGLPVSKPRVGLFAGVVLAFIAVVAVAAFLLGQKTGTTKQQTGNRVTLPYEAGTFDPRPVDSSAGTSEATTSPNFGNILLTQLQSKSTFGSRILDAWFDPRTNQLNLLFSASNTDDVRYVGAHLGRIGLENYSNATIVSLRAIQEGKDVFFAEVSRTTLVSALSLLGNSPESDQAAFANALLSNEWPSRAAPTPDTNASEPEPTTSDSAATSAPADSSSAGDSSQN